jgi:hypothetical protein
LLLVLSGGVDKKDNTKGNNKNYQKIAHPKKLGNGCCASTPGRTIFLHLASKLPVSRHKAGEKKQSKNCPFDNCAGQAGWFRWNWVCPIFFFHDPTP